MIDALCSPLLVLGVEVQPAAAILAVGVDHPADEGEPAVDLRSAFGMVALGGDAVADVAIGAVWFGADGPAHGGPPASEGARGAPQVTQDVS